MLFNPMPSTSSTLPNFQVKVQPRNQSHSKHDTTIIAILIYTVPVFVYRYRIKKCALENKAAIKFTAIYGVIMLVILGTLLILANYFPIFVALIIWSYINYYVLSYKA